MVWEAQVLSCCGYGCEGETDPVPVTPRDCVNDVEMWAPSDCVFVIVCVCVWLCVWEGPELWIRCE